MNLAEFPLASISDRLPSGLKTVVFEDHIFDRKEGRTVQCRLTISGSDCYGLPTATDDDVLLACLQLSKLQDFVSPIVAFSRYELLKLLRWSDDTRNYHRLAQSLRRWKGISIFSDRSLMIIRKELGSIATLACSIHLSFIAEKFSRGRLLRLHRGLPGTKYCSAAFKLATSSVSTGDSTLVCRVRWRKGCIAFLTSDSTMVGLSKSICGNWPVQAAFIRKLQRCANETRSTKGNPGVSIALGS